MFGRLVMYVCGEKTSCLQNVKWVFFDVGGVLVDSNPLFDFMATNLHQKLHVDVKFLKEQIIRNFVRLKSERGFKTVRRLFYESMLEIAGELRAEANLAKQIATEAGKLYAEFFIDHAQLYPDALPCLESLKKLGFKLGIISDADWNVLIAEMKKLEALKYFSVIVTSSKVKSYKPDRKIFTTALKLAGCLPNEAVYIGDAEVDAGSKQAGFIFILLDRKEKELTETAFLNADITVNNLQEAAKLFTAACKPSINGSQ